ncbi:DUF4242 domain-containing protein [Chryseolinea soli]|uniref:DUF4242 domain-containing protein n=1 Tax=Chryseolinea soli TaxID=2321403 RepID=UPI001E4C4F02|nr:DUF4242 domain-containing protein [Chryseolinea soli]
MKNALSILVASTVFYFSCSSKIDKSSTATTPVKDVKSSSAKNLYLDVHNLEPGKVTFEAVAGAHQKDLATQGKYDVSFIKYWVDEAAGKVYCLAESPDSASVYKTHQEAHGLVPQLVRRVSDGPESTITLNHKLFLDIHQLGAGNVTAEAVAAAHAKDLATQGKYDVNFINYWVDEQTGTVMCLSEAKDEQAVINTHKEAHGLIPNEVRPVKQGK